MKIELFEELKAFCKRVTQTIINNWKIIIVILPAWLYSLWTFENIYWRFIQA